MSALREFAKSVAEIVKQAGKAAKEAAAKSAGSQGGDVPKDPAHSKESALAGQIRSAIASGGINIGIYMIGDPDKNNDKEFKRQAVVWAGNHGAFGLSGSQIKKDYAMPLSADPGKLITNLLAAMKKELGSEDTIPIANVALFTHGGTKSMQIDSKGEGGGEKWANASNKVVKEFAAAVKPALTGSSKIHLFACNTAKDKDASKGRDDATRSDSFAEDLQELTGAEIWGHEDARHTTGNPQLVEVSDTNQDANAERYQLRDVLARKFLMHVDSSLTEPQMGYLELSLKISKWINSCMQFKGKGFNQTNNYQIFIEEVSMMGYDKLFDLMIEDSPPDANTFRGMFPEHDQIDKLTEGAAAIHAQFHKALADKKQEITSAKAKPEYPSGK